MLSNLLVPLLFACVFQSICLIVSGRLSGEFDLQIAKEGNKPPYPKLIKLKMMDNNTVPAARHHIIPRNRIKQFYNEAVISDKIKKLPLFLTEYKKQFKQFYEVNARKFEKAIKNIEELIDGLIAGTVVHKDGKPKPKDYSFFIAFYMWLPGNLFIGPNPEHRADEPKEEFEFNSKRIIGEADFNVRFEINNAMKDYISQGKGDFTKLDGNLQRMLTTRGGQPLEAYPFNKDDWIPARKKGKYRINV